jgi:hypothetical protein
MLVCRSQRTVDGERPLWLLSSVAVDTGTPTRRANQKMAVFMTAHKPVEASPAAVNTGTSLGRAHEKIMAPLAPPGGRQKAPNYGGSFGVY